MDQWVPIVFYLLLTLIYFYLDYTLVSQWVKHKGSEQNKTVSHLLLVGWFILTLVSNTYFNIKISEDHCGTSQSLTAFLYTLTPHIFILGILMLALNFFPNFISPFSNTIGYFLVNNLGNVSNLFNLLFKSKKELESMSKDPYQRSKLIDLIKQLKGENSIYINEITPNNFTKWMDTFQEGNITKNWRESDLPIESLYNHVLIKNMISRALWLILTGILIVQTSYNSIMNLDCDKSNVNNQEIDALVDEQLEDNDEKNVEKWEL
jgi:hypothetical protein